MNEIVEKYTTVQELDQLINLLQTKKNQILQTEFNHKFEQLRKLLKIYKKPYKRLPKYENLVDTNQVYFFKTKYRMPIIAPSNDAQKTINGKVCQPAQAPNMASNLKSPWPMPSMPRINLKI